MTHWITYGFAITAKVKIQIMIIMIMMIIMIARQADWYTRRVAADVPTRFIPEDLGPPFSRKGTNEVSTKWCHCKFHDFLAEGLLGYPH